MTNSIFDHLPLFILKALGIATPEEEKELEKQTEGKEKLHRLIQDLEEPAYYNERRQILQQIHVEKEWTGFLKCQRRPAMRYRRFYWQAAAVLLLLGGGISFSLLHNQQDSAVSSAYTATLPIDKQGAVLTLSNGMTQNLRKQKVPITETDGSRIYTDSTQLDYTRVAVEKVEKPIYNRLFVGRGFEYMLTLQDGTRVWMNSESTLEYPIRFTEATRRIKLSGEAYFEVTCDTARPFIVEVNEQFQVKVLGTRFNIKAYPEDDRAETTLAEGKVAVNDLVLEPSEQAVLRKNQTPEIRRVNVNNYLAWHEGWFYFENERLEQALQQLGRWYDMQFMFSHEEISNLRVTGKLQRFENLQVILKMLSSTTGCRFEIKERLVYVTK